MHFVSFSAESPSLTYNTALLVTKEFVGSHTTNGRASWCPRDLSAQVGTRSGVLRENPGGSQEGAEELGFSSPEKQG